MYAMSTNAEIENFEIPERNDDDSNGNGTVIIGAGDDSEFDRSTDDLEMECERSITWWYEPIESSLEELLFSQEDDKPKKRLGMDTFRCPIMRMNVTLKPRNITEVKSRRKTKKRKETEIKPYDFYMSVGRNLITVAVLVKSVVGKNYCLQDVHFYEKAEPKIDACFLEDVEW